MALYMINAPPAGPVAISDLENAFGSMSLGPVYYQQKSNYEYAFDNIIGFVNDRFRRIPDDERNVTQALAGPFTPGGLLILMQEPLSRHPWSAGINAVISSCRSLEALQEGISIGSHGARCITRDVSVIDRWPFLHRELHVSFENGRPNEMLMYDSLVLAAIRAKQPHVILCMGGAAKSFLSANKLQLFSAPGQIIDVVYCFHPSHAVNHDYEDCSKRRQILLAAIQDACYRVGPAPTPQMNSSMILAPPSFVYPPNSTQPQYGRPDADIIREFLRTTAELCFPFDQAMPNICITRSAQPCYYSLTYQQKKFLQHTLLCGPKPAYSKEEALCVIVPLFLRLNSTLRRVSHFLPTYTVDMVQVRQIMIETPPNWEQLCLRLVGYENYFTIPVFAPHAISQWEIIQRLEKISVTLQPLLAESYRRWQTEQTHRHVQPGYSGSNSYGSYNNYQQTPCRCGGGFYFTDDKLTTAFRLVYTSGHDCMTCREADGHRVERITLPGYY